MQTGPACPDIHWSRCTQSCWRSQPGSRSRSGRCFHRATYCHLGRRIPWDRWRQGQRDLQSCSGSLGCTGGNRSRVIYLSKDYRYLRGRELVLQSLMGNTYQQDKYCLLFHQQVNQLKPMQRNNIQPHSFLQVQRDLWCHNIFRLGKELRSLIPKDNNSQLSNSYSWQLMYNQFQSNSQYWVHPACRINQQGNLREWLSDRQRWCRFCQDHKGCNH